MRYAIIITATVVTLLVVITILSARSNRTAKTMETDGRLWADRKHTLFGLPLSFTKYLLQPDRLFVTTGFLNTTENEVRLYRVLDIQLTQSLGQRIMGLGSINLKTADQSLHNFTIKNIAHAKKVKEMLSDLVESQRKQNLVVGREYMGYDMDDPDTAEDI